MLQLACLQMICVKRSICSTLISHCTASFAHQQPFNTSPCQSSLGCSQMLIPISTIFVSIQVVPSQGYQPNALILMDMGQGLGTKMQLQQLRVLALQEGQRARILGSSSKCYSLQLLYYIWYFLGSIYFLAICSARSYVYRTWNSQGITEDNRGWFYNNLSCDYLLSAYSLLPTL